MNTLLKTFAESYASGLGSIINLIICISFILLFLACYFYEKSNKRDSDKQLSLKGFYISTLITLIYILTSIWVVHETNMDSFKNAETTTIFVGDIDDSPKSDRIIVNGVEMDMVEPFDIKVGTEVTVAEYEALRAFKPLPIEKHTVIEVRKQEPPHYADSK